MRARSALLIAVLTLLLDLSGALLTTNRTLPTPSSSPLLSATAHRHASTGFGAIAAGLLAWLAITEKQRGVAQLAWVSTAGFLLQGLLGLIGMPSLHATLAHVLVAATAALALAASRVWAAGPEFVRDYGWPSMRSLAIAVPLLTLVQAALGAAFRQQLLGLTPHVIGAMVVSLLILMLGAFVLNQFPTHPRLPPAARGMMAVMFVQVFFGIAAITVRSIRNPSSDYALLVDNAWALAIIGGHVVTGSLTLAATAAMGMLIRREVQPKP